VILRSEVVEDFSEFARTAEPRLRQALCSRFGVETGREATAEAIAVAWEQWNRLRNYDNPVGYLFGVGHGGTAYGHRRGFHFRPRWASR
jgi:hypothetical protein